MGQFRVLDDNDSNQQHIKLAKQLIDEAIEECVPYLEKTAYLEALEKSPQLIETETNPIWFLTYEKWNIWSAAQRIVKYWEWKRTLFGEIKTFLPIFDLSGNGSLDEIDVQLIRSGFFAILPKDDRGNIYLILNRSRAGEPPHPWDSDITIAIRAIFFIVSVLLRYYYSDHHNFDEETGVIMLNIIFTLAPNITVNVPDMITEAMPIRIVHAHQIFYRTESNSVFMEKYIIPSFLAINTAFYRRFTNSSFHYCSSPFEARSKLQQHGIPLECIPNLLGGLWSYDFFDDWFVRFSNENATVVQNEMQHHIIQNEVSGTDAFVGGDGLCHELNNCSLDHVSVLNQISFDSFVCSANLQAALSLDDANKKSISDVDNKWQTEVHDGVTNQKLIPAVDNVSQIYVRNGVIVTSSTETFVSDYPVIDKNEFCDPEQYCSYSNQSVTTSPFIPLAKSANNMSFEKLQDSPTLLNITGDVTCNDAKVVSLPPMHMDEKQVGFLKSGVFMILPVDSLGFCMLSYEPNMAIVDEFELQRCCLAHCLQLLTMRGKSPWTLMIVAYLDQQFVQSKSTSNDTFRGIIESFPNINLDSVHVFFESVCLGWWSYQESTQATAVQMFGDAHGKMSFHVFPAKEDGANNEDEVARPQVMAGMALPADLRSLNLSLNHVEEGALLSKYELETKPFCYPLASFQESDLIG